MIRALPAGLLGLALLAGPSAHAADAASAPKRMAQAPSVHVGPGGVHIDIGPKRRHHRTKHHYRPGHRYDRAPAHWHRHKRRPHNWRKRGCIIVGPVWFCP